VHLLKLKDNAQIPHNELLQTYVMPILIKVHPHFSQKQRTILDAYINFDADSGME